MSTIATATNVVPKYEDINPYNGNSGYFVTNEEPELYRRLLKGIKIKRGAAIASGGDVALLSLLPRTSGELILVDHAYDSITACLTKIELLKKLGPQKAKELFDKGTESWKEVEATRQAVLSTCSKAIDSHNRFYSNLDAIRREWSFAPTRVVESTWRKLDKLTLIHGDVSDLRDRGPFDFVYLSNALEHTGRNGKLQKETISSLMPKGGLLLLTRSAYGSPAFVHAGSTRIKSTRGYRTSWFYELIQIPKTPNYDKNSNISSEQERVACATA